jgi:prepilin-type N-terminal cleavage/methylation domain-containing protein
MTHGKQFSRHGFTLTELAIVLAVVGVVVAGLWRLTNGGNQILRDQSAANQQQQLISAVQAYLASPDETTDNFMPPIANNGTKPLPLPSSVADAGGPNNVPNCSGDPNMAGKAPSFCKYLPPGFWTGTTNAYGQTFAIQVLKDNTAAGTPPTTYSFMIIATGGPTPIPDTDGGRISQAIGSSGGFVYTNNVCNAASAQWACGAYGAWAAQVTTYGFAAAGGYSGSIASLTYASPDQSSNLPWLARNISLGTPYNTMTTTLYMGGTAAPYNNINMAPSGVTTGGGLINMEGGSINMINAAGDAPGQLNMGSGLINLGLPNAAGGQLNVQGGLINLQGGNINGTDNSSISLISNVNTGGSMLSLIANATTVMNSPLVSVTNQGQSTCPMTSPGVPANCPYAVQVNTLNASNLIDTVALYASTFIYQASDIRLKKNIHPLSDALPDLMKLKPVSFAFKENDKESLGFIAQDVEQVYPKLVAPGSKGMKSVNYEGLIAPLVASVQELKEENNNLLKKIKLQETKQKELEQELQEITNK